MKRVGIELFGREVKYMTADMFIVIQWLGSLGVITFILNSSLKTLTSYRQRQRDNFHNYSRLYVSILIPLFERGDFHRKFQHEAEKDRAHSLQLFLLFSEEFHLAEAGLINKKIWGIWSSGIRHLMEKPFLSEAWAYCKKQYLFEKNFALFMDGCVAQEKLVKLESAA